jgi:hypothetical protein
MKINITKPDRTLVKAFDIEKGKLFYDDDGDMHLRVDGGSICVSEKNLSIFSTVELTDFDCFDCFKECLVVPGEIEINVKLT